MSLNIKYELSQIAKEIARNLRRNQTEAESLLWERLRNRKLAGAKFYRQYPIYYENDGLDSFYIADFFSHEKKLVIEVDGKIHEYQIEQDKHRENMIRELGFKVIRFKNDEIINNIDLVLKKIMNEIR